MRCFDCQRELLDGDWYIADAASGFIGTSGDAEVDGLIAELTCGTDLGVVFCEECTEPGGRYRLHRLDLASRPL